MKKWTKWLSMALLFATVRGTEGPSLVLAADNDRQDVRDVVRMAETEDPEQNDGIQVYAATSLPFPTAKEAIAASDYLGISTDGECWISTASKTRPNDILGDMTVQFTPLGTRITPAYWYKHPGLLDSLDRTKNIPDGQHLYKYTMEKGEQVPIKYWENKWNGACIHGAPSGSPIFGTDYWHGFPYTVGGPLNAMLGGISSCWKDGDSSGYVGVCAYCNKDIFGMFHYATDYAITDATTVEIGMAYMYTCRLCKGMEVGGYEKHDCMTYSVNEYHIDYDDNTADYAVTGEIGLQTFYHDGATIYEGNEVKGVTNVASNSYSRPGYVQLGWSVTPGGGLTARILFPSVRL